MSGHATIRTPTQRQCERCGRQERWDETVEAWVITDTDTTVGDPHCIHEWDINGSFSPYH